jgi:putative endonuclease
MRPVVYILTNSYNSVLYTGVTSDIDKRIREHRESVGAEFTRRYNLKKLVFVEYHSSMLEAIEREKQIKSWSRARKCDLINRHNPLWHELMPFYDE